MRATAGLGGLEVSSEKAARERPRVGTAGSPCTLRPGAKAPGFPDLRPSPRVPPPRPPRFDVCRGLPGAPGIGWQSRLSGAAAVTLRLGLRAGRKQACVEFLFDPHGGINRKRRAPKPKGPALAFVVGSAIYRLKEVSRDPCPVCRLGTAGGAPSCVALRWQHQTPVSCWTVFKNRSQASPGSEQEQKQSREQQIRAD